mmetsp:Transcript_28691/g.25703  ORF Transcript_28691/g.25703 Transcript_28691/m.25703 type:complete len:350 (-) Transcript_28691:1344-2393(-)
MIKEYDDNLLTNINAAKAFRQEKDAEMKQYWVENEEALQTQIENTTKAINTGDLVSHETATDVAIYQLTQIKNQMESYKNKNQTSAKQYKNLYNEKPKDNKMLAELESKFADRQKIWVNLKSFREKNERWMHGEFSNLDVEEFEKDMKGFVGDCGVLKVKMQSIIKESKDTVLNQLTAEVEEIGSKLPIIMALGNKDLQARHWKKIFELIKKPYAPGSSLTLGSLLTTEIEEFKDEIEEISGNATGQAQIERSVEAIRKKWTELEFIIQKYRDSKDKFIVGTVEEIVQTLEEHQMNVQTMLGTRYVHEIRSLVEEWEKKLALISEVIDEWLTCQRQWMYLENIFTAEDI